MGWSANPLASPAFKDEMQSMFSTAGARADYDWLGYTAFVIALESSLFIVISFVGKYAGSMLRKPSAKTKE